MASIIAAAWALGVGLLVCVVVAVLGWTVGGHGDATFGSAVRTGSLAFVAAHMAPVSLPGATFSLLPLGLLALPALLTYRAGRWAARAADCRSLADVALLTATASATYAFLTLIVSTQGVVAGAQVPPLAAVLCAGLVSAAGVGLGAMSSARLWPAALAPVPVPVRRGIRAGGVVLATLGVAAGAAVTFTLATHLSSVASLTTQVAPGAASSAVLLVLCLLYVPTLFVWALSYLAGTGVLLGGAMITPFGGGGGLSPAFPLLGAVPDRPPALAPLLLLVPVLAGVLGGLALLRSRRDGDGRFPVTETVSAAGVTGFAALVLAFLGSGSLGEGRLAHVGPSVWAMPLALTALVLAGLVPTTVLGVLWARIPARSPAVVDLRVRAEPAPARPAEHDEDPGPSAQRAIWRWQARRPLQQPAMEEPATGLLDRTKSVLSRSWGKVRPLLHSEGTPAPPER